MEFKKYFVGTENETKKIAKEFAAILKSGDIVLLNGNLGTGKTFFVKEILESLNYTEAASPTFSIVNEYEADIKCYHFDFYRIKNKYELHDIGLSDYLMDEDAITFIEWAELFENVIPSYTYLIEFRITENQREINIIKNL